MDAVPSPRRIRSLAPLETALAALAPRLAPVVPERVPLAGAAGFVLAEPLSPPGPCPPWPVASRDGYAVPADAALGAAPSSPVFFPERPAAVEAGERMPAGADAVLPPEAVEEIAGLVEVTGSAARGDGVRERGYDAEEYAPILPAGVRLAPLALAAARACGIDFAAVRRPSARIVTTGDGEGPEAAADLIAAHAARAGLSLAARRHVPDDPDAIAAAVADAAVDLVVTIGGTGLGTTDRTVDGVARAAEVLAHGVALSPGETAAIAAAPDMAVLMLPGRLDAALAAWLALGRPIAARLAGAREAPPPPLLPLARKVVSTIGMTEIVFVVLADGRLEPLGGAGLPLGRLARADGFVTVPPNLEGYQAGALVAFEALAGAAP
ncbi:molybdopterin-binding protein [Prosthecomicrobium sp. N25]|uniref:molybdopterin-binding protein n=1 Tax=Prosthecomicrobium sp. N25 TaxID=3129254 RepID=UPI003077FD56